MKINIALLLFTACLPAFAQTGQNVPQPGTLIQSTPVKDEGGEFGKATLALRKGDMRTSALDLEGSDWSAYLLRFFTPHDKHKDWTPTVINGGGHYRSIASLTVSGQWNQKVGRFWDVIDPSPRPSMASFWADVDGPAMVVAPNPYAGKPDSRKAMTLLLTNGQQPKEAGYREVVAFEANGALSAGDGTWETMDTRFGRFAPGVFAIDKRKGGPYSKNSADGGLALKQLILTAGGALEITEDVPDATMGLVDLRNGRAIATTKAIGPNTRIVLVHQVARGTPGVLYPSVRTAGKSFEIASTSKSDQGQVLWLLVKPRSQ